MRLDHATWPEVESYLQRSRGILLPTGSTEQHGPIGLIGTDAICAELIAAQAARQADALVAPTLAYTPAPFNMAFPGTLSLSGAVFEQVVAELFQGLTAHGFRRIYVLNGHGANLAPLRSAALGLPGGTVRVRSWWNFDAVNALRQAYYGDWEGMHATPSEVAITQAAVRIVSDPAADAPPVKLTQDYIAAHSGDRHGPPDQHRAAFPDGRVGSHSALARPEHGHALLNAAVAAVVQDYRAFCASC